MFVIISDIIPEAIKMLELDLKTDNCFNLVN
jgi:hypothetical protein